MNKTHVMRGLILKDWYGLRSYLVRQVALCLPCMWCWALC